MRPRSLYTPRAPHLPRPIFSTKGFRRCRGQSYGPRDATWWVGVGRARLCGSHGCWLAAPPVASTGAAAVRASFLAGAVAAAVRAASLADAVAAAACTAPLAGSVAAASRAAPIPRAAVVAARHCAEPDHVRLAHGTCRLPCRALRPLVEWPVCGTQPVDGCLHAAATGPASAAASDAAANHAAASSCTTHALCPAVCCYAYPALNIPATATAGVARTGSATMKVRAKRKAGAVAGPAEGAGQIR